jgi:hypothetical protein
MLLRYPRASSQPATRGTAARLRTLAFADLAARVLEQEPRGVATRTWPGDRQDVGSEPEFGG